MDARTIVSLAVATTLALPLLGCSTGPDPQNDPGRPNNVAGVTQVLDVLAPALAEGNGTRACALMTAEAQRAVEANTAQADCPVAIETIAAKLASEDKATLAAKEVDWQISISSEKAEAAGPTADLLADLLDLDALIFMRIDERWALESAR